MRPSDPWLRAQLAPARRQLAVVLAGGLVSCGLVIGQAWAVTGLVIAVLNHDPIRLPGLVLAAVLVARGLADWSTGVAAARASGVVGTSLRRQLIEAAVDRDLPGPTGAVSVLATRGVAAAEPYLTRYLPALVLACVLPALTVGVIATQDLLSATIVLLTLPLVPVFGALVGLATRDRAREQWHEMTTLSGHFLDVVRGLPTLVAHRRAHAQVQRIAAISDRYRVASLRTLRIAFASSLVLELVATLSVALVAVTTGVRLASGSMELHTALVVLLLAPEAYWPLRRVGAEFHAAAEGVATFEAVRETLGTTASPPGSPRPPLAPIGAPLVLTDVTLTHPGRSTPAVTGLSAVIPARGVTVLTGPSGSGKSTLLDAIAGLLHPSAGTVTADGVRIGGAAWSEQVSWLPQRPHFVDGSIADNVVLGRPEATRDQVWDALRVVALEERVRMLPHGLDSRLGEDGTTLSAGERARLALARVVLADRPWVLLDEPTAHLDPVTERVIVDTITELGRDRGVVVVAHRQALAEVACHRIELPGPARPDTAAAQLVPAPSRPTADAPAAVPGVLPRPRFVISTVLSSLASLSGVALTATAGWLIVQASSHPAVLTMLVAIVGVRTFGLARPVLRYAERLRSHDAALRLLARRRVAVYETLVPLTPGGLGRRRGDLLTSIVDDVDSVVDQELRVRMPWRTYALVAVFAALGATWLAPAAGWVIGATGLLGGSGAWFAGRWGATRAERDAVTVRADLASRVVEDVQLARELRMWQRGDAAAADVARLSDDLGAASTTAAGWTGAGRAWVSATAGAATAVLAELLAPAVADGSLRGPTMALLLLIPIALAEVAFPLADAGALSVRADAAARRLGQLADATPAVHDTPGSTPTGGHRLRVHEVEGRWADDTVSTTSCSFTLEPGARMALVGPSGSGKSTVAALLVRFLDPLAGTISHGDRQLDTLSLDDVRRFTGLVDDDPYVFATTLAENVRLAWPSATDAEVAAALDQARLGGWTDSLPDGLHTWLGDGHSGLSGGERARLGVARSILARQPVLVLDEPASHLDHATATELARELLTGPRTRSVLWITHDDVGLDLVDSVVALAPTRRGDRPVHDRWSVSLDR